MRRILGSGTRERQAPSRVVQHRQIDRRFLAALERADDFVDHTIVDQGLQGGGVFMSPHGLFGWVGQDCSVGTGV